MGNFFNLVKNATWRSGRAEKLEETALHPLDELLNTPLRRPPANWASRLERFRKKRAPQLAAFFRLPAELRRQVYLIAFGAREIHWDLRYSRVVMQAPHSPDGVALRTDRAWSWAVSVCHRDPRADANWDHCARGDYPTICSANRLDCRVGAWGWLLACRQAYVEGAEVLFSTNRFNTSSGAIVLFAPRIISHGHASMITHLSIAVHEASIVDHARTYLQLQPGWPAYRALIGTISESFPGLKKLDLLVPGRWCGSHWQDYHHAQSEDMTRPQWGGTDTVTRFLDPVDKLVHAFQGQLEECQFIMERQTFDSLLSELAVSATQVESGPFMEHLSWERYWRSVYTAAAEDVDGPTRIGYWLKRVPSMGLEDDVTGALVG